MNLGTSPKLVDILTDTLREAFKAADTSVFLAIVAATFVLVHGLQSDYVRDLQQRVALVDRRRADSLAGAIDPATARASVQHAVRVSGAAGHLKLAEAEIPFLGFRAELFTASFLALALFWLFIFRAARQVHRARVVARRLATADRDTLEIMALWPSLATASRRSKIAASIGLGVLGYFAWVLYYLPLEALTKDPSAAWVGGWVMVVPVAYLGRQLLSWPPANQ